MYQTTLLLFAAVLLALAGCTESLDETTDDADVGTTPSNVATDGGTDPNAATDAGGSADTGPSLADTGPSPECGNGIVEGDEICDGDCPTACDDGDTCTTESLTGSAATCDAVCDSQPVVMCANGDGCCPDGCDETNDDDCMPMCGNEIVETGETCDGDCPTTCDDTDACTVDAQDGMASSCDLSCSYTDITACTNADGCCPAGCDGLSDDDCAFDCTDPATWPVTWSDFETELVRLLNVERSAGADCGGFQGVFAPTGSLTRSTALQQADRCHSKDMSEVLNTLTYDGSDGSTWNSRCLAAGQRCNASLIGPGLSAAALVAAYMSDPSHCELIMQPSYTEVGVGFYPRYWTISFSR